MNCVDQSAAMAAAELDEMVDRLDELEDYAVEMGYRALEHKIQEARGRLASAQVAATQYAEGTLTPRD